nr:hypothetical protein Itr_chr10CG15140 [Ipomoea trifida]
MHRRALLRQNRRITAAAFRSPEGGGKAFLTSPLPTPTSSDPHKVATLLCCASLGKQGKEVAYYRSLHGGRRRREIRLRRTY